MPDLSIGVAFKPANRGRSGVVRWGGGGWSHWAWSLCGQPGQSGHGVNAG